MLWVFLRGLPCLLVLWAAQPTPLLPGLGSRVTVRPEAGVSLENLGPAVTFCCGCVHGGGLPMAMAASFWKMS